VTVESAVMCDVTPDILMAFRSNLCACLPGYKHPLLPARYRWRQESDIHTGNELDAASL